MLKRIWLPVFILTVCFIVPLANATLEKLSFESMLFPWLVGGLASILLFWEIVKGLRETREEDAVGKKGEEALQKRKKFIEGIAWVFAILPMMYLVGIIIAIPIYLFAFLKYNGEKLWICISLPVIIGAFFYFVFIVVLNIPFYEGILWPYVNG
jgi:hypothetical protein